MPINRHIVPESSTNQSFSIRIQLMLDAWKRTPVWFDRGYRLISAVNKELLKMNVFHGSKILITKKSDYESFHGKVNQEPKK